MAEVRLRKDFYGSSIPKRSSQTLNIYVFFDYTGPAQTLNVEVNTGKKGLFGDYDQESPAYRENIAVLKHDTPYEIGYFKSIPLSFWGDRKIDDCAVEVVIKGKDVYDDAVLWDAYTVGL